MLRRTSRFVPSRERYATAITNQWLPTSRAGQDNGRSINRTFRAVVRLH